MNARVVVAEPFAERGLAVLRERGLEVVSCVGASREVLRDALESANALIVRSETKVDDELLEAGPNLSVVARAGVGVDAIDVEAATRAGIVVLNTPGANTLAAAEQTFALMLSLARRTPDAVAALRAGRWERKPFIGTELAHKTLGIVGLGRIGGAVAERAVAFGMNVIAADPYISPARAQALGVTLVSLDELLDKSDVVTLHVPLGPQTLNLIDAERLARLRSSAYLINCARGGVIDEDALLRALDAGALAGAALDVVADEPPPPGGSGARLQRHPRVVATPHLGGSTHEALERIAIELASDVAGVLLGGTAAGAVNAPVAAGPDAERLRPFADLAYRLGRLYPQLGAERALPFSMVLAGELAAHDSGPLCAAFLTGLLRATTDRRVSIANATAIAADLGVVLEVRADERADAFAMLLRVGAGDHSLAGTCLGGSPRIVEIDGFEIDANPSGALLLTRHHDVPGMVGRVGTILGEANINISTMQVSRQHAGAQAIMILGIERPARHATLELLRAIDGVDAVHAIEL